MVGNIVLAFGFVLLVIYLWKKSKGALIGLFVCIAVLAIGMHYGIEPTPDRFPSGTWNYKITLTVQTPEGVMSGSSVRQVYVKSGPNILPQSTSTVRVRGEAVVVDLGKRGTLFGLLRSQTSVDGASYVFFDSFPIPDSHGYGEGSTTPKGVRYYNQLKSGKADVQSRDMPMLVRFKDINNPKTVERVDPSNLAATFGEGVKLVSATIEITDEPVTTGIENVLGWLGEYYNKRLDGDRFGYANAVNKTANSLSSGEFSTGGAK